MVVTEKVYIDKPLERMLEATVLEVREHKGKPAALLDRTIFYPEGEGRLETAAGLVRCV